MHLMFYDGECGLCDRIVQFLLKADTRKIFVFAPLQGTTAATVLKELPDEYKTVDSLVLVENYQQPNQRFYVMGQGAFRILWLLGGWWVLLGWKAFLPPVLYDWGYRLVARNRHKLFRGEVCELPDQKEKDRFLP